MNSKRLKSIAVFLSIAVLVFSVVSCTESTKTSIGKPSEIVVVTDTKAQWENQLKDTLVDFFYQYYPGLPQAEPSFTLVNIPEESFIQMFKRNRSILIMEVNEHMAKPRVEYKKNEWAKPQAIVKISAPDINSLITAFEQNKSKIYDIYSDIEYDRLYQAYKYAENKKIVEELQKTFGIYMTVPNGFEIAKQNNYFIWLRKETNKNSQGFIIYQYDYTSQASFKPEEIISKRNQYTKKYIPGPSDSSYMSTDTVYVKPVFKEINIDNNYVVETRGLWNVVNDFMGGPFLSYTFVNQNTNKVITIDAYIYAPGEEKRDLIRELETILNSLEIVEVGE